MKNPDDPSAAINYLRDILSIFTESLKQANADRPQLIVECSGEIKLMLKERVVKGKDDNRPFMYVAEPGQKKLSARNIASLVVLNLISGCNLEPRRFGVCNYASCKNYFYRTKSMKKNFCSDECANRSR